MTPCDGAATEPLAAATAATERQRAWLVGGAVRDRLLGRPTTDFDVVVDGDPAPVARAVARSAGGHAFELSEAFGAWRVVERDHVWQLDVLGLAGADLHDDLARRDLTVNAIAQPLAPADAALVDPFGGVADITARRLAMVSDTSFSDDPLRVLRLARLVAQLHFVADPETVQRARRSAPGLAAVAPERVFAELRSLICAPGALAGLSAMDETGATAVVLPELDALRGVAQSRFHHLDVLGHTREVLAATIALTADPGEVLGVDGRLAATLAAELDRPLANELTRGGALRIAALLHDIAKPVTRGIGEGGRVTFMGHDEQGARLSRQILGRLRAAERLRDHVAALARHHLRLGFLVHRRPLTRRDVYDYLHACAPVGVDVTLLSVADRLATRGDDSDRAISVHLELAREMLPDALRFAAEPPRPPLRGDELARALGIAPGPRIGPLLAELTAAAYAGEVTGREQAIGLARTLLAAADG